jgi:hypothetical protein
MRSYELIRIQLRSRGANLTETPESGALRRRQTGQKQSDE